MEYNIEGTVLQMLEVELSQGESIYTESGGMAWMSDGIDMKTDTKGGLMSGLGRADSIPSKRNPVTAGWHWRRTK